MTHYCPRLYDGLVFDLDSITPCCHGVKYTPPKVPYAGGRFPLEEILTSRKSAENQLPIGPCQGCPHVQCGESPSLKFIGFKYITFDHFYLCNNRCKYCSTWNHSYEEGYKLANVVREMDECSLFNQKATFSWGGGEPTLLDEFDDLLGFLHSKGYHQFVNTNGVRYSNSLANSLYEYKTELQVSIDSGTPETYLAMKGRDYFSEVVGNLTKYASCGDVLLKYIVTNSNCEDKDLQGFLEVCLKTGIKRISISPEANESWSSAITQRTIDQTKLLIHTCREASLNVVIRFDLYGPEYTHMLEET